MEIRQTHLFVNEVFTEGGREVSSRTRVAAAAAVMTNPFAGRYVEDLSPLKRDFSAELAKLVVPLAIAGVTAGVENPEIYCFGKGAVVGLNGEIEHGSALIHNLEFGKTFRDILGGGDSMLPSVEKRGGVGASIDVPLKHRHDASLVPFHQTFEIVVPDAPHPDEIIIIAAVSLGGRPHARIGGTE
jgi:hypothetical protein